MPNYDDIDTYLNGLSNNALDNWRNYWINKWNKLNNPNKNHLKDFTNNKHDEYFDSPRTCSPHNNYSCYNNYIWWFNSCGDRESIKEHCSNGCSGTSCNSEYPKTISRLSHSFKAYNQQEEIAIKDFLGIDPQGVDIDTYLNGLSNNALNNWRDHWINTWVSLNDINKNTLISFTNNEHDLYYDAVKSCTDKAYYSCYNGYVWWFDSCGDRTSIKDHCSDGCNDDSCIINSDCPNGWIPWSDSCYKSFDNHDWLSGKSICESVNAHLVTIDSSAENNWVHERFGNAWIGFNDRSIEGSWVWTNGHPSFIKWGGGEPNNAGDEDCAVYRSDGAWNDWSCSHSAVIVCELDGVPVNKDGVQGDCDDGWTQFNNHCYRVERGSWTELNDKCHALGGYLVNINNLAENNWVLSFSGDANAWIGYSDHSSEGVWVWTNDSSYSKWHNGEPNNCCGGEDCAQFWTNGDWNDAKCNQVHNGVCEKLINCDDGNACTKDFYNNGCHHEPILNCHGDGVCDSSENYCNAPSDCPKPTCNACEEVKCVNNQPTCQTISNCCGNSVCEPSEGCECSDCDCTLSINFKTIQCKVNNNNCYETSIYNNDPITTSFELINPLNNEITINFLTSKGASLGAETSTKEVTHEFKLEAGKQVIIINLTNPTINKTTTIQLISLTINDNKTINQNKPFDYSSGSNKELPNNNQENNNDLINLIGLSTLSGASAIALSRKWQGIDQGTYVPPDPKEFLKQSQLTHEEALRREELWDELFNGLNASADFIKGFIFGSDEHSSTAQVMGDFVAGVFVWGDLRDVGRSIIDWVDPNKEVDSVMFGFAVFGLFLELIDRTEAGDAFASGFKVAWKKLPKKFSEPLTFFFKKLGSKLDDYADFFNKVIKKVPPNKVFDFLTGLGRLSSRLIKFGDDITFSLLKKMTGLDEIASLSKYIDDVGDASFSRIAKKLDADEILDLTNRKTVMLIDKEVNVRDSYLWINKHGNEIDEAFEAVSKKFPGLDNKFTLDSNSFYNGCYNPNSGKIYFSISSINDDNDYFVALHEFTHKASDKSVIIKGFDDPTMAYNQIFNEQLGTLKHYYIDESGFSVLENQFHDTVVNKLMLTNKNADFNKWYSQWLKVYEDNINLLNKPNVDFIKKNKEWILPELAEMKVLFEQVDIEKAVKIEKIIESVRSVDFGVASDFDRIYDAYKEVFNKVNWK